MQMLPRRKRQAIVYTDTAADIVFAIIASLLEHSFACMLRNLMHTCTHNR
jgi:hypothetical protein